MKLTRRELAMALAPAAALAQSAAPSTPPPGGDAELEAARARMKANGDTLARQAVPMDVEPAFRFQA